MNEFTTKNAAARHRPADGGGQLDVRDMRRLVQALPQYRHDFCNCSLLLSMLKLRLSPNVQRVTMMSFLDVFLDYYNLSL